MYLRKTTFIHLFIYNVMTQEELDEIFKGLEAQGWNPRLCDFELPYFENKVSCGRPVNIGDLMRATKKMPKGLVVNSEFMVEAVGDSMKDVNIEDGDIVLVDGNENYYDGDHVLALVDDEYTLKTYHVDENGIPWLIPENDDYLDCARKITENDWIVGVVTGTFKKQVRTSYNSCHNRLQRAKKLLEGPQVDPRELMTKAVEKTIEEGLWASNTCWSVVFAAFREKGYPGSYSDFITDVETWKFTKLLSFQCNKDSVARPFRDRKMMAPISEWEERGVKKPFCLLGKRLLDEMKSYKRQSIPKLPC